MTENEANEYVKRLSRDPACYTQIVRILPETIDPIKPGDNGWDVKIMYHYNDAVYED
jgi:hypothetical protein